MSACVKKYENVSEDECKKDHSETGWTAVNVMKKYLKMVVETYG